MEVSAKLVLPVVVISVLVACSPGADAWYKQVAGPSYYSVGRASGLLSGIRRSPYVRRAEAEPSDSEEEAAAAAGNGVLAGVRAQNFLLKSLPVCIRDVTPNLQSCELFQEFKGSFRCKADIFLSLDSSDCAGE